MASKPSRNDRIFEFLKQNPEQAFTAYEIAEWFFENYPEECKDKQENSNLDSEKDLLWQLASETGAHRKNLQHNHPEIKTTEGRPRKFYYTEKSETEEIEAAEHLENGGFSDDSVTPKKEADLYPVLYKYLLSEDTVVYAKRIDEKKSSNKLGKDGNHWLYPDLVGLEPLNAGWIPEIKDCVKELRDKLARLWSFEVKLEINSANVRKCFFQAVSNSSWANFGYLVAENIAESAWRELRILSATHGIGVIKLDKGSPSDSYIMIPARQRMEIDWDAANRLAEVNADFQGFLKLVREFYQIREPKLADWPEPISASKD
jgi:hypothetical protein